MVEPQPAGPAAAGEFGRVGHQQPVLLVRCQSHEQRSCHGRRWQVRAGGSALLGLQILQPDLAAGDQSVLVVGDGHQPQLLAPAAVDGSVAAVTVPDGDRPQEVGVVVHADDVAAAVGRPARRKADMLAMLSIIEQYTPPCTMPIGCSSLGVTSSWALRAVGGELGESQAQLGIEW